eukprot:3850693-Lingulodinium_polyedra.AAC.1
MEVPVAGDRVLVLYVDDELYQERMLGALVRDQVWAVVTPDLDVYIEDLDARNPAVARVRWMGPRFQLPPGIAADSVVAFGVLPAALRRRLLTECQRLAAVQQAAE